MEVYAAAATYDLAERVAAARLPSPDDRARIRRASRATLRDFAAELGVSPMTIRRWETGESEPRMLHAIKYRALLDAIQRAAS